jgi:hypothetical protein
MKLKELNEKKDADCILGQVGIAAVALVTQRVAAKSAS